MAYLIRRLGLTLAMIYVVVTITFFLVHLLPGNPYTIALNQLLKQGYTRPQAEQQVTALFGYSTAESIPKQYVEYIGQLLQGNLGTSLTYPDRSVVELISTALPWTVLIVSVSLLLSFGIGILLGGVAAYRRGGAFDRVTTAISSLLNGFPQYLTGLLLFYFFAIQLGWFPVGGAYGTDVVSGFNVPYLLSVMQYAVLPITAFVLSSFAGWVLAMKSNTVTVLGEDFITAANVMGIDSRDVVLSYIARNAILPLFTGLVLSVGYIFGGSVFVEQVFNYPGLGHLFVESTNNRDFPLMQGCFLLLTTAVLIANVAADLLYSRIDPRIS